MTYIGFTDIPFTIEKKAVTVAPKAVSVTTGGTMPIFELAYTGLIAGESLTPSETPDFTCTAENTNTAGTYPITWSNAAATTFTGAVADNYAITKTASGTLTVSAPSSSGGGPVTPPTTNVPVIVDGKSYNIGTQTTTGTQTTVTVNQTELNKQIANASEQVIVPVAQAAGVTSATAQLVAQNVDDMAKKEIVLSVQFGNVTYQIPAEAIDTASISAALGQNDHTQIPVSVTIAQSSSVTQSAIAQSADAQGFALVLPAVDFTITASYGGKTVEVAVFDTYVSRDIKITAEQAKQITTAIVYEKDGTVRHIPTEVYQKNGNWYARANSLTNSTYAFIFNQQTFGDLENRWYKAVAEEMASRKVINGKNGAFAGDQNITRAEFAAMVVRSLGLPANGASSFADVPANAWYSAEVATAAQYGITNGVGNNQFDPSREITRQEAMAMVMRAASITPLTAKTVADPGAAFSDYSTTSAWAQSAVDYNLSNGLIVGSNGLIRPQDSITRAEVATILLRLLQTAGLVDVRSAT